MFNVMLKVNEQGGRIIRQSLGLTEDEVVKEYKGEADAMSLRGMCRTAAIAGNGKQQGLTVAGQMLSVEHGADQGDSIEAMSEGDENRYLKSEGEIPDAPFYVLMRDTFLSGWGQAEARDAFYIAVCHSKEEANAVAGNAKARDDQDKIRIVTEKPHIHREVRFALMTRETSAKWYEDGAFAADEADKDETYNGWTNWDTWNVSMWLEDEPDRYEATRALVVNGGLDDLRAFAMEFVEDDIDPDKVNWQELHDHYGEEN